MLIRQSTIKTYSSCALKVKWAQEGYPREQSSALSFGTVIHDAILHMEKSYSYQGGLDRFNAIWDNLEAYNQDCEPIQPGEVSLAYDYIMPRNSHVGYSTDGHKILRDWWSLIQWESDVVLAREYNFTVDVGDHQLTGTLDKLALRPLKDGGFGVLVSDYKTSRKQPTRDYLRHDIQFHAYCYATTRPEFWVNIENGAELYERYMSAPRLAEWVHLRLAKRIDAGERVPVHYTRLAYTIDQIDKSQKADIWVPTVTGETCEYCEFRNNCGLPTREEEMGLTIISGNDSWEF
jgi:CRISPR/Cas system-associated exonuclease Cas4 (RecB family)